MKFDVRAKLETVFKYPFFQTVGQALPPSVTSVESWPLALRHRDSRKWENCRLMARNALDRFVEQSSWERAQEWNPLVQEAHPIVVSFLERLLLDSPIPQQSISKVKDGLCWDILGICLEHEYSDIVKPIFYMPQLEPWYESGHFPCGWDGREFPVGWDGVIRDGRLIVF